MDSTKHCVKASIAGSKPGVKEWIENIDLNSSPYGLECYSYFLSTGPYQSCSVFEACVCIHIHEIIAIL